jgi:hypothetical protein
MNADDGVLLSGCQAVSDFSCLGAGLPPDAERELRLAGMAYHEDGIAEAHLRNAIDLAPWHVAVHIGLYRFYFYKGRLQEALRVAANCLEDAAARIGIAGDWREVRAQDAEFGSYEAVLPRFYLFTLKAYEGLWLSAYAPRRSGGGPRSHRQAAGTGPAGQARREDPVERVGASGQ